MNNLATLLKNHFQEYDEVRPATSWPPLCACVR
jgi:hypothetical protein